MFKSTFFGRGLGFDFQHKGQFTTVHNSSLRMRAHDTQKYMSKTLTHINKSKKKSNKQKQYNFKYKRENKRARNIFLSKNANCPLKK